MIQIPRTYLLYLNLIENDEWARQGPDADSAVGPPHSLHHLAHRPHPGTSVEPAGPTSSGGPSGSGPPTPGLQPFGASGARDRSAGRLLSTFHLPVIQQCVRHELQHRKFATTPTGATTSTSPVVRTSRLVRENTEASRYERLIQSCQ